MGTDDKIRLIRKKRAEIAMGGGAEKQAKQRAQGKATARERLSAFFDQGSFIETDAFVTHRCSDFDMPGTDAPAEGVVTGYGTVDGRLVCAYAQDFTVIGGSLGEMHAKKICKVLDTAIKLGAPVVGLLDSGGARIQEGVDALAGFGEIFYRNTLASGLVPQISVIMGPCAGGSVYSPALTDFVVMTDKTSKMFITGPSVIKAVTGEDVTAETLGGAAVHAGRSGVAHLVGSDDMDAIAKTRRLLSFVPSNNLADSPPAGGTDDLNRICPALETLIPEKPSAAYDMKDVIREIADFGEFFELHETFAPNIIVGFVRMGGRSVGIVANQPKVMAAALDVDTTNKAARFIRFCDAFNIPLVTLTDVPGYLPGVSQEYAGIIRHGAKLLYAYSEATVPKINVIIRKAYGGAYIAMSSKHLGADAVFAWPTAEIAVMGPDGAANIIFRKEIAAADDPVAAREEKIGEYRDKFASPLRAAERGYVDDIIEPAQTRQRVIGALEAFASKQETRPSKKHGNIPL